MIRSRKVISGKKEEECKYEGCTNFDPKAKTYCCNVCSVEDAEHKPCTLMDEIRSLKREIDKEVKSAELKIRDIVLDVIEKTGIELHSISVDYINEDDEGTMEKFSVTFDLED